MGLLQIVFWGAVFIIVYTYFGYAALVTLLARWKAAKAVSPPEEPEHTPTVTLIIAAYNEEAVIARKLENSLALDYPPEKLEIVVAADGSDDETCAIVRRYAEQGVKLLWQPERRGKAAAVNRAVSLTQGEIIVFSDANAMYAPDAIRKLVRHFADPRVGCVAGRKRISEWANGRISESVNRRGGKEVTAAGEGLYWRYESHLKRCDSIIGSMMGAPGEIFAVRRELYTPPEEDSLIEDFIISMRIVARGYRAVYEPEAVAWEEASPSLRGEWRRRVRISAGGVQAVLRLPEMLSPRRGILAFQYISHRVLRWMVTPWLLPLLLIVNASLIGIPLYRWLLVGQGLFYGAALVGGIGAWRGRRWWPFYVFFYFCMLNAAALVGWWRYLTGRQPVTWAKARG